MSQSPGITKNFWGRYLVHYRCPFCRSRLKSPLADAGKTDYCPDCRRAFMVPGEGEACYLCPQAQNKTAFTQDQHSTGAEVPTSPITEDEQVGQSDVEKGEIVPPPLPSDSEFLSRDLPPSTPSPDLSLPSSNSSNLFSSELAFVWSDEILDIDLQSKSLQRDVSRARRRLLADIAVSDDGVVQVAGYLIDQQTVVQIADMLADSPNVQLLRDLSTDDPLRRFLASGDPVWAKRIRERPYYTKEGFATYVLPPLRSALRCAIEMCWKAHDGQNFARVIRILDHIGAEELQHDVEECLGGHLQRLKDLHHALDEPGDGPVEKQLVGEISKVVSISCLNALPPTLASFRSSFFHAIRNIAITCREYFHCSRTSVRVLKVISQLELNGTDAKQLSNDMMQLQELAVFEKLNSDYSEESRMVESACEEIENLAARSVMYDPGCLRSLIPTDILNRIPADIRTPLFDRLAAALLVLSTVVWNEGRSYSVSRYLLRKAEELPISDDAKEAITEASSRLQEVWIEGLSESISTAHSALEDASTRIGMAKFHGRVNKEAVDRLLDSVTAGITEEDLFGAQEHSLLPSDFFTKLHIVSTWASRETRQRIIVWLERAGVSSSDGQTVIDSLEGQQQSELVKRCVLVGAIAFVGIILLLWGM